MAPVPLHRPYPPAGPLRIRLSKISDRKCQSPPLPLRSLKFHTGRRMRRYAKTRQARLSLTALTNRVEAIAGHVLFPKPVNATRVRTQAADPSPRFAVRTVKKVADAQSKSVGPGTSVPGEALMANSHGVGDVTQRQGTGRLRGRRQRRRARQRQGRLF